MNIHGIGAKIVSLGILLIFVTAVILAIVVFYKGHSLETEVAVQINKNAESELISLTQSILQRTRAQYETIEKKLASDLYVAHKVLQGSGGLSFDPNQNVTWAAVNQFTKESVEIELPQVMIGQQPLEVSTSAGVTLPVVDEISDLVGATCTIFQRMNPEGDMLRVATNVLKMDGERAIGTYIPGKNPDGEDNPVVKTVLKGETFYGRAFVVNDWYLTAYEPIKDASGEVIGVLYVGVALEEQLLGLKDDITDYVIGQTGYMYVLDSQGTYIVSKNNERNGENIWETKGPDGRYIIQDVINTAKATDEGKIGLVRYAWQNSGEDQPRSKIAGVAYFAPLDWIIGASTYESELQESVHQIHQSIDGMLSWVLATTLIVILVGAFLFYLSSRRISKPILDIARQARMFSRGEIELDENDIWAVSALLKRKDELGQIARSFEDLKDYLQNKTDEAGRIAGGSLDLDIKIASGQDRLGLSFQEMTKSLNMALGTVKDTANFVATGSGQVSDSSHNLSTGATEQAASIEQVTALITELTGSALKNADTAEEASRIMSDVQAAAESGTDRMKNLVTATEDINASSREIATIIKTIDDIAFQTNLLALNAAVEAARAGKHGKGFAVVAQEVRNLAGRSARAARETAELIDGSVKKIESGNKLVNQTSEVLGEIMEGLTKATNIMTEITAASNEQAHSIAQVSQGLTSVEQVTQQSAANAEEMASAAESLSGQARELHELLSRFELNGHKSLPAEQASFEQSSSLKLPTTVS